MAVKRNTATRDKHRAIIARRQEPCHLCGEEIDYSLPHTDPMSFTVDHVTPLARGGTDTLDNSRASHRACNRAKSANLITPGVTFETERAWW